MSTCPKTKPCNECNDCFYTPLNIVIIDNNQTQIRLYATILRNHCFANDTIKAFTDSVKALRYMSRNRVDLIISNQDMSTMTGYQLFETLTKLHGVSKQQTLLISDKYIKHADYSFFHKSHFDTMIDGVFKSLQRVSQLKDIEDICHPRFIGNVTEKKYVTDRVGM